MEKTEIKVFSVVRDMPMYVRCVKSNPFMKDCSISYADNNDRNLSITRRYNDFLDSLEEDCWVVLCHEDWEVLEPLAPLVRRLDPAYLWGPVGVFVEEKKNVDVLLPIGKIIQSRKDDKRMMTIHGKAPEGRVDSFDCQCLIFHSSLVREHGLRFDECLTFDMYVEDFCVSAYEKCGIESRVVPLACHHHSLGVISESFKNAVLYLRKKYAVSKKKYGTTVGHLNTFGGDSSKRVFKWKHAIFIMLRYRLAR